MQFKSKSEKKCRWQKVHIFIQLNYTPSKWNNTKRKTVKIDVLTVFAYEVIVGNVAFEKACWAVADTGVVIDAGNTVTAPFVLVFIQSWKAATRV